MLGVGASEERSLPEYFLSLDSHHLTSPTFDLSVIFSYFRWVRSFVVGGIVLFSIVDWQIVGLRL